MSTTAATDQLERILRSKQREHERLGHEITAIENTLRVLNGGRPLATGKRTIRFRGMTKQATAYLAEHGPTSATGLWAAGIRACSMESLRASLSGAVVRKQLTSTTIDGETIYDVVKRPALVKRSQ